MYVRTFTFDEKRERVRNCQGIQENDCAKKFCCNSDSCNWLSDISMISMLLRLEPEKNLGKLHPSKQTNKRIQYTATQRDPSEMCSLRDCDKGWYLHGKVCGRERCLCLCSPVNLEGLYLGLSVELFSVKHHDGTLALDQVDALLCAVEIPPRVLLRRRHRSLRGAGAHRPQPRGSRRNSVPSSSGSCMRPRPPVPSFPIFGQLA